MSKTTLKKRGRKRLDTSVIKRNLIVFKVDDSSLEKFMLLVEHFETTQTNLIMQALKEYAQKHNLEF